MYAKLVLFLMLFYGVVPSPCVFGQQGTESGYEPGVEYSICYERHQLIKVAYIDGISSIGDKKFLQLTKPDAPASDTGMQIAMDSIIAIIPANEARDGHYNFCR